MLGFEMSKKHRKGGLPPKKAEPKRDYTLDDEDDNELVGEDRSWGEKGQRPQPPRPRLKISHSSD